jgi:alkylation response protein AidB-like acyl-CoA dehydrogenase
MTAFAEECQRFLDAYPRKATVSESFEWGRGSDSVAIFEEHDVALEQERLAATKEWREALYPADLAWIAGPVDLGGRGLTRRHQRLFDSLARRHDTPGNSMLTASLGVVAPTIASHGTQRAKQRYLMPLQRGRIVGCQLFSEPGAGSDLASIATRAEPDGSGWRITGQKVWTSGAQYSDIGEAICRTAKDGRHRNLTAFVVDMHAPGVEVRPLRQMTGGAAFNEVFLDGVRVTDDDRLGAVGDGWRVALTSLANEREALAGGAFGGAGLFSIERYRAMAHHFGVDRDPVVRQALASLYIGIRIARYMRMRTDAALRAGQAPGPEASLGKLALVHNLQAIGAVVSRVLGPRLAADTGEWGTYSWSGFVLGAPGMRIGGGTDEIMRNIIGERVLGLAKEPEALVR